MLKATTMGPCGGGGGFELMVCSMLWQWCGKREGGPAATVRPVHEKPQHRAALVISQWERAGAGQRSYPVRPPSVVLLCLQACLQVSCVICSSPPVVVVVGTSTCQVLMRCWPPTTARVWWPSTHSLSCPLSVASGPVPTWQDWCHQVGWWCGGGGGGGRGG